MKSILISIKPQYVAKILNGENTIEIRKTMPKCDFPIDVYIYCTKGDGCVTCGYTYTGKIYPYFPKPHHSQFSGKVVAKFTLNKVEGLYWKQDYISPNIKDQYALKTDTMFDYEIEHKSGLSRDELEEYIGCETYKTGYAWHIDNLVIFDRPKELGMFSKSFIELNKQNKDFNKKLNILMTDEDLFYVNSKLFKIKAPQSWCYVEVD